MSVDYMVANITNSIVNRTKPWDLRPQLRDLINSYDNRCEACSEPTSLDRLCSSCVGLGDTAAKKEGWADELPQLVKGVSGPLSLYVRVCNMSSGFDTDGSAKVTHLPSKRQVIACAIRKGLL